MRGAIRWPCSARPHATRKEPDFRCLRLAWIQETARDKAFLEPEGAALATIIQQQKQELSSAGQAQMRAASDRATPPAPDGRQRHGPGATWTDAPLSCLIAAWDGDAFRVRRAQRGIETVIPARFRRTNPQPYAPERSPARHAGERGLGWLKRRHRVARPLRPIRVAVPGFSVLGGGLALAEILYQHYLAPRLRSVYFSIRFKASYTGNGDQSGLTMPHCALSVRSAMTRKFRFHRIGGATQPHSFIMP